MRVLLARLTTRFWMIAITEGLTPPKTHWALPLDKPPFFAYAVRPGVTFTYMGLRTDEKASVFLKGQRSPNLFAAGEISAGNVLGKGYTAGVGMSIGTVFGRIAGTQAALAGLGKQAPQQQFAGEENVVA